jgi:hypothetical protein
LKSATYSAAPEKVDAKTVQRKLKPRFSTSDFIALLGGGLANSDEYLRRDAPVVVKPGVAQTPTILREPSPHG